MKHYSLFAKTLFCGLLMITCASSAAQEAELITRAEALAAYNSFNSDPIGNLEIAPTFLNFIKTDGEAHVVLYPALTAWMYENHEAEARAVLYAAYMGGNMNAQLVGESKSDDPVKAMESVLAAYMQLKKKHAELSIPLLDSLEVEAQGGSLASAVEKIVSQ